MERTTHPSFTGLSPDQLAAAVEENLSAMIRQLGLLGEYREDSPPGVKRVITGLRSPLFNAVAGARLAAEQAEAAIEQITADARTRGTPILWFTGPLTRPADLEARLETHGFTRDEPEPGMVVDLAGLNEQPSRPADLTVRRVGDEAGWRQWADVTAQVWGGGPITNYEENPWCRIFRATDPEVLFAYVGRLSDQPVASSLMLLGAGVAGLYLVSTLPDARHRGIGTCVCLEPLLEARRRGYCVGVLEATAMGLHVYHRLGFKEVCQISAFLWKP